MPFDLTPFLFPLPAASRPLVGVVAELVGDFD